MVEMHSLMRHRSVCIYKPAKNKPSLLLAKRLWNLKRYDGERLGHVLTAVGGRRGAGEETSLDGKIARLRDDFKVAFAELISKSFLGFMMVY